MNKYGIIYHMRIFLVLLLVFYLNNSVVLAGYNTKIAKNTASGTFKKSFTGKIIQYDEHGKKIGVYRNINGRYVKIK